MSDLTSIEVLEWDTVVYYSKAISMRDFKAIIEADQSDRAVEIILKCARNEDGSKIFLDSHRADLTAAEMKVIVRIADTIDRNLELPTLEEASKK